MKRVILVWISVTSITLCTIAAERSNAAAGLNPSPEKPVIVKKVLVNDCRVVRGFLGAPVDGTVHSRDYRGIVREYPKNASDGIVYSFNSNDGVHIQFTDDKGFDMAVLRGGAGARLYSDADSITEPKHPPLWRFPGKRPVQLAMFEKRIPGANASVFGIENGALADISFYRLNETAPAGARIQVWRPGQPLTLQPPLSEFSTGNHLAALHESYGDSSQQILELSSADSSGNPVSTKPNQMVHLLTPPFQQSIGLTAVAIDAFVSGVSNQPKLTCVVQDPLNPRLDLTAIELPVPASGRLQLILDIPDQVLLEGTRFWVSLGLNAEATLSGPDGGAPQIRFYFVPRADALPEAVAWRKLQLKTLFSKLSEPRPWGAYRKQSRDEFFASSPYARQCPELFLAIDQCHALAPDDPIVRQYREWVYLHNLEKLSDQHAPPAPPSGVPAWAWYSRMAWLETRRIAEWWLDHRLVETGEFGGNLGDDSDLYQQFSDLPFFESDGVGARLGDAAARLAELAERENLRGGLNRHAMDALHAYEEGINHLALMTRWFYGDPIYLERCMESARNMEHLTVVTPDGRRHFRDFENMGARDIEQRQPPSVDGQAAPLMWHTALQSADYNRNPTALRSVQEWADSWLQFMKPGQWATAIDVISGRVIESEKDSPLSGGYRTQATVFAWLAALTAEKRFIEPFMHYYRQGQAPGAAAQFASDCFNLGFLDGLDRDRLERLSEHSVELALYLKRDIAPTVQATIGRSRPSHAGIGSLNDAQRWPDMYTSAEQFTDRVFPDLLSHASTAYLGGYTRRNKFNPTLALSWEGFGTNYAALVLSNRRNHLKFAAFNFTDRPLSGRVRLWALEHGRYELVLGPAESEKFELLQTERSEEVEIARGDRLALTLPPGRVSLIELRQTAKLDSIFTRPDLAVAAREIRVGNNNITGVVHNIGATRADEVRIALVDPTGRSVANRSLGPLDAPSDLRPRRIEFALPIPDGFSNDWRIVIDPDNALPEINEENNEAIVRRR